MCNKKALYCSIVNKYCPAIGVAWADQAPPIYTFTAIKINLHFKSSQRII